MAQLDALTPNEMVTQFESLVDDSLDETTEYFLLNDVKDTLEADDEWALLKAVDETQTANAGDTYLTMKTLPADFGVPNPGGIFVGNDLAPWVQVKFEDRVRWQSVSHRYYIDFANNQYALCGGVNPGGIIHFFYQKSSPALAAGGSAWIFPSRFHPILPMLMSIMYPAIDQPDKSRAWDDRWNEFASKRLDIMRRWNARLLQAANANSFGPVDLSSYPNVVDMGDGGVGGGAFG